jgi:hypothetical protein
MRTYRRHTWVFFLVVVAFGATAGSAIGADTEPPMVNYVSADAVYLNVGRYAGLEIGARVEVVRNGRTIAVLEVLHVSSNSSSCRIVEQTEAPTVGDAAVFTAAALLATPATEPAPTSSAVVPEKRTVNMVSGYVEFQNVWQQDLTGSDLSSLQPAIAARVRVKNIGGTGGELRIRDRIRYYHRDRPAGALIETGEWYHRLTELAFVVDAPGASITWGVGRLIAPYMIGIGLVDGGYFSVRFAKYLRAGAAGGLAPDPLNLNIDSDRVQAGGYLAFDYESLQRWRFTTSAALTGSYKSGTVSREFVYWQNVFNLYRRFALFQSVEIDINRDWRRDAAGEPATFSNFFINASAELTKHASVDFSYDSRQNVRVYETKETPDSLFDDVIHDGYRGGLTFRLPYSVILRGYGGIRYRDGNRTNRYVAVHARASQLPWRGHAVLLRYAYADSRTVTGHRPGLEYRFPAGRRTRLDAGAGGYIYEQGTRVTTSIYGDIGAYYTIGRYFASGKYRQYFGGGLESILFFAEFGVRL